MGTPRKPDQGSKASLLFAEMTTNASKSLSRYAHHATPAVPSSKNWRLRRSVAPAYVRRSSACVICGEARPDVGKCTELLVGQRVQEEPSNVGVLSFPRLAQQSSPSR